MATYGNNVTQRISNPGLHGATVPAGNNTYSYTVPANSILHIRNSSLVFSAFYQNGTTLIKQYAANDGSNNPIDYSLTFGAGMVIKFSAAFVASNLMFHGWLIQNTP